MPLVIEVEDAIREETHRRVESVSRSWRNAVRAIYGSSEARGLPEPIGSCTFTKFRDQHLVVTAAHVIDHAVATSLHIAGGKTLEPIRTTFATTQPPGGNRDKDLYDFAVGTLTLEQVSRLGDVGFIGDRWIPRATQFPNSGVYLCLGYPISKNRKINVTNKTVKTQILKYASYNRAEGLTANLPGSSSDRHIFVQFDPRHTADSEGKKVNAIDPTGASGGPAVYIGNLGRADSFATNAPIRPMIAGILTKNPKLGDAIRVTRIDVILRALEGSKIIPESQEGRRVDCM